MRGHVGGDVHRALQKSSAIIEATSIQTSGKWMKWRRADMLKFTLILILASLLFTTEED